VTTNTIGFSTAGSEAMRIDSSGNLLVGTTDPLVADSTNGGIVLGGQRDLLHVSRVNQPPVKFSRANNDGDIAVFAKNGTSIGSIGIEGGDITIGRAASGLQFRAIDPCIRPHNMSTNSPSDNAVDLGRSNTRFKDAYLSGGVYLGGTGSANKLEDYEEGTWTPVIYGTSAAGTWSPTGNNGGGYVKIGNQVTCWLNAVGTLSGASGEVRISGLPFPNAAVTSVRRNAVYSTGSIQYWAGISVRVIAPLIEPGQTTMYFHTYGTNDTQGGQPAVTNTSHNHHSFVTYMVE
jgi:hypothetical protein